MAELAKLTTRLNPNSKTRTALTAYPEVATALNEFLAASTAVSAEYQGAILSAPLQYLKHTKKPFNYEVTGMEDTGFAPVLAGIMGNKKFWSRRNKPILDDLTEARNELPPSIWGGRMWAERPGMFDLPLGDTQEGFSALAGILRLFIAEVVKSGDRLDMERLSKMMRVPPGELGEYRVGENASADVAILKKIALNRTFSDMFIALIKDQRHPTSTDLYSQRFTVTEMPREGKMDSMRTRAGQEYSPRYAPKLREEFQAAWSDFKRAAGDSGLEFAVSGGARGRRD